MIMSGVSARAEETSVELYVRSLSPRDSRRRIEDVVRRLDELVEAGSLERYRVVPTGRELPPTPADAVTDFGAYLLGRLAVFQEWARATGRSVDDLFERRTARSRFTGEDHDALVLQTMIMAEYHGEDLRFVAPCLDGDDHVTVRDRLATLEAGEALPMEDRLARATGSAPFGAGWTDTGRDSTGAASDDSVADSSASDDPVADGSASDDSVADDSLADGGIDWPTPETGR